MNIINHFIGLDFIPPLSPSASLIPTNPHSNENKHDQIRNVHEKLYAHPECFLNKEITMQPHMPIGIPGKPHMQEMTQVVESKKKNMLEIIEKP